MTTELQRVSEKLWSARSEFRSAIEEWSRVSGQAIVTRAPEVAAERLTHCRVFSNRVEGLKTLPRNARCVEVGTQAGYFARQIIDLVSPKELHLIDLVWSHFNRSLFSEAELRDTIKIYEGYSNAILDRLPDAYFDWIYIDASHAYENVKDDIDISGRKLKPGGLIICNDYTAWSPGEVEQYGVMRALNEFCEREDWEFIYLALQGEGFHDVCVRKRI
jgi:predicted O-methyltransferase YrrM